ncbi:hypothetical protein M9H77_08790 [Catharanthus roseus]|uniref:Uncharacterized protein n=1 Tax=Catharanthus roseus TaxID=4058 RepID=A0ACC0BYV0_CATRO|nr:hypothetical protein M9H77_08790 [Catharanthus roseus]
MRLEGIQEEAEGAQQNRIQEHGDQGPEKHTGEFRSFIEWVTVEDGQGVRTVGTLCPTASKEETVGLYTILPVLDEELKAKAERLHIETDSPIPTDEHLMFEATGGCNKGHIYSFSS